MELGRREELAVESRVWELELALVDLVWLDQVLVLGVVLVVQVANLVMDKHLDNHWLYENYLYFEVEQGTLDYFLVNIDF